jgi:hypothetical protein
LPPELDDVVFTKEELQRHAMFEADALRWERFYAQEMEAAKDLPPHPEDSLKRMRKALEGTDWAIGLYGLKYEIRAAAGKPDEITNTSFC